MTTIASALQAVRERIARAAHAAGRSPDEIHLLAVSKTQTIDAIRAAISAGQRDFGENYVQEAVEKIRALPGLGLQWHFIGPLQSNKTRQIAESCEWVHSIDRASIAERLSQARSPEQASLQVCVQVNISAEATKHGVTATQLESLARHIQTLPRLKLRGLMAIPEQVSDVAQQKAQFRQLKYLFDELNTQGFALDTLSMGMSHDLEAAIAEGSTLIRVGTAIFGARTTKER